ncbi:MAG: hypothetical protein LBJ61_11020 [Deltaproteobacteria bacterium]|nr:hypothetical protein [Deltaproteobacteria bacterium]
MASKLAAFGALMVTVSLAALGLAATPALADDGGHGPVNPNSIDSTLKALTEGNARFVAGQASHPNQTLERVSDLADHGQTPMAAVLACSDSRVPVEELFDLGFGDLFVIRAAGAVPGVDQIGSLEYAVAHLGVPVVLVLSHTSCGAVSAAVTGANEPGALGELLKKLSPAAAAVEKLDQAQRLQSAVELSAIIFREQLPLVSPVLGQALKSGQIAIVSGVYDIATGEVKLDLPKPPASSGPAPAAGSDHGDEPGPTDDSGVDPSVPRTLPAPAPDFGPSAPAPEAAASEPAAESQAAPATEPDLDYQPAAEAQTSTEPDLDYQPAAETQTSTEPDLDYQPAAEAQTSATPPAGY